MECDVEALDGDKELGTDCMGEGLDDMELEMGGKAGILASNHEWHLELVMVLDMMDRVWEMAVEQLESVALANVLLAGPPFPFLLLTLPYPFSQQQVKMKSLWAL